MKKSMICLFVMLNGVLYAQPSIQWQKCLGGTFGDKAYDLLLANDGGYIVAGVICSDDGDISCGLPECNGWVVKLNQAGSIEWQWCLGGNESDEIQVIRPTNDGGYILAGNSWSNDGDLSGNHGGKDIWVAKLDSTGSVEWQRCLGGNTLDFVFSLQVTADNSYILAGQTFSNDGDVTGNHGSSDFWVVKLDSAGATEWQRCLGGTDYDCARSVCQTDDGGYIVGGYTSSKNGDVSDNHGSWDAWIVKLDGAGMIQWKKCLGGTSEDMAYSMMLSDDGGYIMAGHAASVNGDLDENKGERDVWIAKLDQAGAIVWQNTFGGSGNDYAHILQATSDNGYIVGGYSQSKDGSGDVTGNHGVYDCWIIRLNDVGNLQWQKSLGGMWGDYAHSIHETADGGYIVAGYTTSNDADVSDNHGDSDFWIVKLGPLSDAEEHSDQAEWQVFPNPVTQFLEIRAPQDNPLTNITIVDLTGRECGQYKIQGDGQINLAGLSAGLYLVSIQTSRGKVFHRTIVKQ